ncbi:LPS O-antigen chain length determinant protein WzzB [Vibrio caribbeanicus]|uniref:LPS O-antigen chain length determinant protein WzzB n=1 Tax=Vibrio caribbeanicus TaxID=701175 RepID=UPI0030D7323E
MNRQNQPLPNNDNSPLIPPSFHNNNEVDLRELFKALWDGKLIIVLSTLVFALSAVVYALTVQEWWSSKAKVIEPQEQDFAAYQNHVKQYQPIFNVYQDDGTVLISKELEKLTDNKLLFKRFIDAFDSSENKRDFLNSSKEFQTFKTLAEGKVAPDKMQSFYASWIKRITVKKIENRDDFYQIAFQSKTKESSYLLLNQYIETITHKTHQEALNNLKAIVSSKRNELVQERQILENQAETKLLVEIQRAKYALEIAKSAGVAQPILTNSKDEMFDIELGAKAIAAKIKALESIKNLSVIEPRLQQVNAKLKIIESLKTDHSIQFQTVSFFENVVQPVTRDRPKRVLVVILGAILGVMLGVVIALARFTIRRS